MMKGLSSFGALLVMGLGLVLGLFNDDGGGGVAAPNDFAVIQAESDTAGVIADGTFEPNNEPVKLATPAGARLLVFTRPDCQPCPGHKAAVVQACNANGWKHGEQSTDDVQFIRSDDLNKRDGLSDTARRYAVTIVPTSIAVDKSGNEIARLTGAQSQQTIDAFFKRSRDQLTNRNKSG